MVKKKNQPKKREYLIAKKTKSQNNQNSLQRKRFNKGLVEMITP